jgi:hypothetical protein
MKFSLLSSRLYWRLLSKGIGNVPGGQSRHPGVVCTHELKLIVVEMQARIKSSDVSTQPHRDDQDRESSPVLQVSALTVAPASFACTGQTSQNAMSKRAASFLAVLCNVGCVMNSLTTQASERYQSKPSMGLSHW